MPAKRIDTAGLGPQWVWMDKNGNPVRINGDKYFDTKSQLLRAIDYTKDERKSLLKTRLSQRKLRNRDRRKTKSMSLTPMVKFKGRKKTFVKAFKSRASAARAVRAWRAKGGKVLKIY